MTELTIVVPEYASIVITSACGHTNVYSLDASDKAVLAVVIGQYEAEECEECYVQHYANAMSQREDVRALNRKLNAPRVHMLLNCSMAVRS